MIKQQLKLNMISVLSLLGFYILCAFTNTYYLVVLTINFIIFPIFTGIVNYKFNKKFPAKNNIFRFVSYSLGSIIALIAATSVLTNYIEGYYNHRLPEYKENDNLDAAYLLTGNSKLWYTNETTVVTLFLIYISFLLVTIISQSILIFSLYKINKKR